jgi:hypothetical protein
VSGLIAWFPITGTAVVDERAAWMGGRALPGRRPVRPGGVALARPCGRLDERRCSAREHGDRTLETMAAMGSSLRAKYPPLQEFVPGGIDPGEASVAAESARFAPKAEPK